MKKNMGSLDKSIRTIIAAIIALLYFTNVINGTIALVLLVVAIVFALTSLINFCPLYKVIGVTSCKMKDWGYQRIELEGKSEGTVYSHFSFTQLSLKVSAAFLLKRYPIAIW